jgi:hypothetical protein
MHLAERLFLSLWLLHYQMHGWIIVRTIPTATVKMVNKIRINETLHFLFFYLKCDFKLASWLKVDLHTCDNLNSNVNCCP